MSKNGNPKRVLKKGSFFKVWDHNALNFELHVEKTVMLIFRKKLDIFNIYIY
jgi:hypothetical protein